MIRSHLKYKYKVPSEFSSWSVSLLWVLIHAVRKAYDQGESDILVYVMDTRNIQGSRIHSATKLLDEYNLAWEPNDRKYAVGEYFVHGKLDNSQGLWQAVDLDDLLHAGLCVALPGLRSKSRGNLLHQRIHQLRKRYFTDLWQLPPKSILGIMKTVAQQFGDAYEGTVMIALITSWRREMTAENVTTLLAELQDMRLPQLPFSENRDLRDFQHVVKEIPEARQFSQLFHLLYDREIAAQREDSAVELDDPITQPLAGTDPFNDSAVQADDSETEPEAEHRPVDHHEDSETEFRGWTGVRINRAVMHLCEAIDA